ncbi:lantibiotic dehydratase [Nonomuraea sp. 3N208]|uniref:lantibiotic dehydratase n=1 Tax=Nonomuraea sp. 3N208 TaxID=3457421 RepID=UPI003FD2378B
MPVRDRRSAWRCPASDPPPGCFATRRVTQAATDHGARSPTPAPRPRTPPSLPPARKLCAVNDVLAADTAVDGRISLPRTVLDEAAAAASVLLRLTTRPFGPEVWRDFHLAFRARYGPGALVPVRELIADSGLGPPAGFLGAARERPLRPLSDRDSTLLALIQQAAVDGRPEITLTEPLIRQLTVGDPAEMVVPQRAELPFQVDAESADAVARGRRVGRGRCQGTLQSGWRHRARRRSWCGRPLSSVRSSIMQRPTGCMPCIT